MILFNVSIHNIFFPLLMIKGLRSECTVININSLCLCEKQIKCYPQYRIVVSLGLSACLLVADHVGQDRKKLPPCCLMQSVFEWHDCATCQSKPLDKLFIQ